MLVGNDDAKEPLCLDSLGIRDPRVTLLNRETNLGEVGNMNDLLARARGKHFAWLSDDDLFFPHYLEAARVCIERQRAQVVFPRYQIHRTTNAPTLPARPPELTATAFAPGSFLVAALSGAVPVISVMGIFRTEYLRAMGGFPKLSTVSRAGAFYGEYLLFVQTAAQADPIFVLDSPAVVFRDHADSFSAKTTEVIARIEAGTNLVAKSRPFLETPLLSDCKPAIYLELTRRAYAGVADALLRTPELPPWSLPLRLHELHRALRQAGDSVSPQLRRVELRAQAETLGRYLWPAACAIAKRAVASAERGTTP